MPLNKYAWEETNTADPEAVRVLSQELDIPSAAARFLVARSFTTTAAAHAYLESEDIPPPDPFLFDHMERAVAVVRDAIAAKKGVLIHGDYDVDGICGTAMLYEFFDGLVPDVFRFVPDRRKDGYGIATRAVDWALEKGVGLFISVDCGTSDADQIGRLETAGVDVVICDHHELPADGVTRGVLLNPARSGEGYPFRGLCGTGVALKFLKALEASGVRGAVSSEALLDFFALATVGDMAPLVEENRTLVRRGLGLLNRDPRPGLRALRDAAGIEARALTATHIGFSLAPRLNAPGRIASPKPALEILSEKDRRRSARLASVLETDNERRRFLTEKVTREALDRILKTDWKEQGGFVLTGEDWDEGVLGIAASRVVEDFGRPALLISLASGTGKGSGRSVPGVHLKEQLDKCAAHLMRFGGHAGAVGFSIEASRIGRFTEDLSRNLKEATASLPKQPGITIDTHLALSECTMELLDFLAKCEPFGYGNRSPVWRIPAVTLTRDTRIVGGRHLKLDMTDANGNAAQGICFNWSDRGVAVEELHGRTVDLVARIRRGYYLDREYAEIQVRDMRDHRE